MAVLPPDPVFCLRTPEMGPVNSICFHQNERLLAGTAKGSIHLWDLQTNRPFLNFEIGPNPITSLHHCDENLFTQEKGGNIKCWSLSNTGYTLKSNYETNHIAFCRCDIIKSMELLVFPKDENSIGIIGLNDNDVKTTLTPPKELKLGHITSLKVVNRSGENYILAGYESSHILTWDLRSANILSERKFDEIPMTIDYDPLTNRGIYGGPDNKIAVFGYQPRQSMELNRLSEISIKNAGINCVKIRPDQKVFVSAGWDGRIRIFSWKSLRPLAVLTEHKNGGVMDISFSDGKVSTWNANIMAAGGVDGQITLWDLYN